MVRAITRLRYRRPPVPVSFKRIEASDARFQDILSQRAAQYVVRQSNPRHIRLRTVVDLRAKRQPNERPRTGDQKGAALPDGKIPMRGPARPHRRSIKTPPQAPFTVKKIVDPHGKAQHGKIIYVFRNTKTNQIIYSLQELLDKHHLRQLAFIGKHSKPPALRPDEWSPHCIVTFPTPEQGQNAYRQLREFRKLHELAWLKTNPEYKAMAIKKRIGEIMDQRANMSADLAAVLRLQRQQGRAMGGAARKYWKARHEYLKERWAPANLETDASVAKEKDADRIPLLRKQIRQHNSMLKKAEFQSEEDQKRLANARHEMQVRLKKIELASNRVQERKEYADLSIHKAAVAKETGADARLEELKNQIQILKGAITKPDITPRRLTKDKRALALHQAELITLEESLAAQAQARWQAKRLSILRHDLKKVPPTPYTLDGVRVQWKEMQDALYAADKWPTVIEHEPLEIHKWRDASVLLSPENFDAQADEEIGNVIVGLRSKTIAQAPTEQHEILQPEPVSEPEKPRGIFKYLSRIRLPWSGATA